ncbi:tetratricopeptide repeat protein [Streptomyces sp. NPDC020875]|uniref:AfsR/SARP family transcriptional regulator n=1 Tax=Streptomyces sp. NPDC020875 TaxID=3154898 RepID=UPI0033D6DC9B
MDGRVLGPVRVEAEDGQVAGAATKAGALFALLVTSPGLQCDRKEIAEVLWEGAEVTTGQVDRVISVLRKLLGRQLFPFSGKSGFVRLRLPEASVDYLRFRAGCERAAAVPLPERVEALRTALAEWASDDPLQGLGVGFREIRERLWAERISAGCELLAAAQSPEYEQLFRAESKLWFDRLPTHNVIFRYYLLAHGEYTPDEEREQLIRRFTERGGQLDSDLQHVIDRLRGDRPRSGGTAFLPIPAQLPARKRYIVGQSELVDELVDYVCQEQDAGRAALVVLSGMAGVGKSTVAVDLAWRLQDRFRDGVLYDELNGFADGEAGPTAPELVLDNFLAALPPYSTVTGLPGKSKALRSALARRSMLVVLDDALSAEQVRPLLPGADTCAVIITSRNDLGGLCSRTEVHSRKVELLCKEDALELLQVKVPEADRRNFDSEFKEVVRLCGRLPLALTVVAQYLKYRPVQAIRGLVREMQAEESWLGALDLPEHEMSVRVALKSSVRALTESARLLLWQLAIHPGPNISWETVTDVGSVKEGASPDRALGELVAASLLDKQGDGYRLHDLVRVFARHHMDLISPREKEALKEVTERQILECQLHNVRACDRVLDGQRILSVGEPRGVTLIAPEDLRQAMTWLDQEYETSRRCIDLAVDQGHARYTWLLPMSLVTYQWRRHRLDDALRDLLRAADAAEAVGSPVECAMVHRMLAGTHWHRREFNQAAGHLRRAVFLSRQDDSPGGRLSLARSRYALGVTLRKQGEEAPAEDQFHHALILYRETGDLVGEAATLNGIGAIHNDRGDYDEALGWCGDALRVVERTPERGGLADVLHTLAKVHLARSERDEGIKLYRRACDIYREQESWPAEDKARRLFAEVLLTAGSRDEAVKELERVLVLRQQMEGMDTEEIREALEALR